MMESTDNKPGYTLGRGYNPSVSRSGSDLPPHVRFKNTKMKQTLVLLQFMKILRCNHLHTDTQHNTTQTSKHVVPIIGKAQRYYRVTTWWL